MSVDYPRAVLVAFATAVVVALLLAASTSGAAFGAYNPSWDGTSTFRSMGTETNTSTDVVRTANAYRNVSPNGTLAVVLSPEERYDDGESAAVRQFVSGGGTLLVAEDFGPMGNRLLRDVGAETRFDGAPLRDERRYGRSPAFPIAQTARSHPYTTGVDRLALNHGTTVTATGANATVAGVGETDVTVLVASSPSAYRDRNGNGTLDDGENLARSPVVTVERVGDGRVVAVSDPSVFLNAMLTRADNRAFARTLYQRHDRVVLDASHGGDVPPVRAALLAIRDSPPLQVVGGTLLVALVAGRAFIGEGLGRVRRAVGRDGGPSEELEREAVVAAVRDDHPEWDEPTLERVTEAIMDGEPEGGPNE